MLRTLCRAGGADVKVEAERRKRAAELESEGIQEVAINVAEGRKKAQILASEGEKAEQINKAASEAQAVSAKTEARSKAIRLLSEALAEENRRAAALLSVAAHLQPPEFNSVLLLSNTGDASEMVTQTIYSTEAKS